MPTTVILSAHGRLKKPAAENLMKLPVRLFTSCKFGEGYRPDHLGFKDLSMFLDQNSLYEYIMHGKDHYSQGEVIELGQDTNNVVLTPFTSDDTAKSSSWQKPFVERHLTKTCIHELAIIQRSPPTLAQLSLCSLSQLDTLTKDKGVVDSSLIHHIKMIRSYSERTEYSGVIKIDRTHSCSLTKTKNGLFYIFDYEAGPSRNIYDAANEWTLSTAVTGINTYLQEKEGLELLGVDSYVLQACLA